MTETALQAHLLRVHVTATDPIALREQAGPALRGAFYQALQERFCINRGTRSCTQCSLLQTCPVATLVAPLRDEPSRIRAVPCSFAIRPPEHSVHTLKPGDPLVFGVTLFGRRLELFPYVAMALQTMGKNGMGQRVETSDWQRGRFTVDRLQIVNPLTGQQQTIQEAGKSQLVFPDLPTTWSDALMRAAQLPSQHLTLHFITPLRLKEDRGYVTRPLLLPLVKRLLERYDFLALDNDSTPFTKQEREQLLKQAAAVEIVRDDTQWTLTRSHSSRQGKTVSIAGLTGMVTYSGELKPLLPLLVWGTVMQVGKATTKGNGIYEIEACTGTL